MKGRLRRMESAFVLFGGPRRCGERTERGKLLRCSGPKKQNDGRPLLFGCVDTSIVALTSVSTQPAVSGLFVAILR